MESVIWNPASAPEQYNGPCFRKENYLVASRLRNSSAEWAIFKIHDGDDLVQLPANWAQVCKAEDFGPALIEQGLSWAEFVIQRLESDGSDSDLSVKSP